MSKLLAMMLLLSALALPAHAEDQNAGAAATVPAAPEPPPAPSTSEPEHKGLSINVNIDDKDKEGDDAKFKSELHGKVLNFVDRILKEADANDMSEEDKREIRKALAKELGSDTGKAVEDANVTALAGMGIGALAVVLIFGTPIMIVAFVLYASYRKRRLIHDTINGYVASGKEIPPEVLKSFHEEAAPRRSNLQKGMVLVGVGLGIIVAFMAMDVSEAAALGAIPLFIGAAQLLIWKLEKNGNEGKSGN